MSDAKPMSEEELDEWRRDHNDQHIPCRICSSIAEIRRLKQELETAKANYNDLLNGYDRLASRQAER